MRGAVGQPLNNAHPAWASVLGCRACRPGLTVLTGSAETQGRRAGQCSSRERLRPGRRRHSHKWWAPRAARPGCRHREGSRDKLDARQGLAMRTPVLSTDINLQPGAQGPGQMWASGRRLVGPGYKADGACRPCVGTRWHAHGVCANGRCPRRAARTGLSAALSGPVSSCSEAQSLGRS